MEDGYDNPSNTGMGQNSDPSQYRETINEITSEASMDKFR